MIWQDAMMKFMKSIPVGLIVDDNMLMLSDISTFRLKSWLLSILYLDI